MLLWDTLQHLASTLRSIWFFFPFFRHLVWELVLLNGRSSEKRNSLQVHWNPVTYWLRIVFRVSLTLVLQRYIPIRWATLKCSYLISGEAFCLMWIRRYRCKLTYLLPQVCHILDSYHWLYNYYLWSEWKELGTAILYDNMLVDVGLSRRSHHIYLDFQKRISFSRIVLKHVWGLIFHLTHTNTDTW